MKRTFFLKAMSGIDDALILEADPDAAFVSTNAENKKARPYWRYFGGIAAALVVICGVWVAARLGRVTMEDAEADIVYDTADGALGDDHDYVYSSGCIDAPTEAETGVVAEKSEHDNFADENLTGVPDTAVPETGVGTILTAVTFTFYEDGEIRKEHRDYPDGVPDAQTVVNDYLAAAGCDVRCVSLTVTATESKTEVSGGVISYTPGIRTATLTFTADPGDDILKGTLRVLNQLWTARYYHFETEDGERLKIGDTLPDIGYDPRDYLN